MLQEFLDCGIGVTQEHHGSFHRIEGIIHSRIPGFRIEVAYCSVWLRVWVAYVYSWLLVSLTRTQRKTFLACRARTVSHTVETSFAAQ